MCLQNMTFKWLDSSARSNSCLFGTRVCEEVFLAPVPLMKETTSVKIVIESSKTSMHIPSKRAKYHNIRQSTLLYSQWQLDNTTIIQPKNIAQLKAIPRFTSLWSLKIGQQIILTSSEFETHRITKFEVNKNIFPQICSNWTEDLHDILSLPDRLVIASKYGVMEYLTTDDGPSFSNARLILPRCVISLDTVSQSHHFGYHVTALVNDSSTFFFAKVLKGISLDLKEAKSPDNFTLCEELAKRRYRGCRIIAIGSTYSKPDKLFILVTSGQHLLVEYSVNSKLVAIYAVSGSQLYYSKFSSFQNDSYNLTGMSFTQLHADHLFIWGNALMYSPDAGRNIFMLSYLKDDVIKVLTTSHQGDFAFITRKRKVFFGKIGMTSLRQLRLMEVDEVLTIFFDSAGDIFQLSLHNDKCNKSNCIQKIKIPLRSALHRENLYIKTTTRRTPSTKTFQEKSDNRLRNSAPGTSKIERACPFAKINVRSKDFQRFTRTSVKLYCRNRLTTEYATKLSQIKSSLFWSENIKAGSNLLKNCLWEDSSYNDHRLPEEISLGLDVCYTLEIVVYLNHPDLADVYFHNFKMDDLKLSVSSSKPEDLLVYLNRTVNYAKDNVHFKINLCDSGLGRAQKPPGTGQEIVSTEIKMIGAEVNCIANGYKDSTDTQGSFTTRVLLGCPACQKVVFDSKLAKAANKHYCVDENADVPCFHFDREFLPIFIRVDEASLKTENFAGRYTLVIVAGGRTLGSIRNYTSEEQHLFNFQTGWLCSSSSPCSGIAPVFPHPPVYYFIIEFSNRKVDSSNCDFTFRFTIKIVGIQPGSINPSLIIVLVWIGLTTLITIASFFIRKRYGNVLDRIQWSNIFRCILRRSSQPQPAEQEDTSNKGTMVMESSNKETMGNL
eukprot:Seg1984.2_Seg1984.3 transcript_id=Seg1984.2_Seg1984.3/GoldUCD/mRNA.D3Y31 product="Cation channel sperm-associated protein subunit gamma 2" protein_id=Seg1984.2_Seg1984.3/GoldUCD/D3Y31